MMSYKISPAADADLDGLAAYLADEAGMATALHFYDAAATTFEAVARMPGIGEQRDSANPRLAGLRVWRIESFERRLVFLPSRAGIEIVRVLHGARDIATILAEDALQ